MLRLSSPFLLDLRSLALFRITLGSIMIYDVMARLPYAGLFLSDSGALSRSDLLATVNRPWSFSIYMMLGETGQAQAALLLHGLAALALALGLWTRMATIACWVMLLSLQHRNPLVLNGGDTLLALYTFWAMFLPLNARFSLDRLLARKGQQAEWAQADRYHGVPGAALVMQTILVYLFTWYLKSGELWRSGEAVGYVTRNIGLIKSGGLWFQQFEWLHAPATWATYHWEWFGLVLILCPIANPLLRTVAVTGFIVMHLAFGWMLDLALFPAVSITGWLALLPTALWSLVWRGGGVGWLGKLAARLKVVVARLPLSGGPVRPPGPFSAVVCAVAIGLVFVWNMRGLPDSSWKQRIPQEVDTVMHVLKLRQKWSMFAADPPRNAHWYAIEAQLANGDSIDLFNPGQPYTLRPPELFTDRLPDRRWGKFLGALRKRRYQRLRDDFLEYLTQRWNERAAPQHRIAQATLVHMRHPIRLESQGAMPPEPRRLKSIRPKGVIPLGEDRGEVDQEDELALDEDAEDL